MRVRKHHAIGHVGFRERGGEHFAGEVTGLVGIAFAAAGAAAQAKRNVVFGEDVGQALDLAGVGHGEQHLIALPGELLHFFQHRGNRAVEARRGLGQESDRDESASSLRVMPRCSTSAPVRDATFFHQSSGGIYRSTGRTRLPTPLRS